MELRIRLDGDSLAVSVPSESGSHTVKVPATKEAFGFLLELMREPVGKIGTKSSPTQHQFDELAKALSLSSVKPTRAKADVEREEGRALLTDLGFDHLFD